MPHTPFRSPGALIMGTLLTITLNFQPAFAATKLITVSHPSYDIQIDQDSALIVHYVLKADPSIPGSEEIVLIEPGNAGFDMKLSFSGDLDKRLNKGPWSQIGGQRNYVVKDKSIYVFFDKSDHKTKLRNVRFYIFKPDSEVIAVGNNIENEGKQAQPVTARLDVRYSPQGMNSGTVRVVEDATRKRTSSWAIGSVRATERWTLDAQTNPSSQNVRYKHGLIAIDDAIFTGLSSKNRGVERSLAYNPDSHAMELQFDAVQVEPGEKNRQIAFSLFAGRDSGQTLAELGWPMKTVSFDAPARTEDQRIQKGQSVARGGLPDSADSAISVKTTNSTQRDNAIKVTQTQRTATVQPGKGPDSKLPAALPVGDELTKFYWQAMQGMLTTYAGERADMAVIDKIISDFKKKVTVRTCELTSDQWHSDLGVLRALLTCTMQEIEKEGGEPGRTSKESQPIYMKHASDGWQLIIQGSDEVACVVAREKDTYRVWDRYQKAFPQGICSQTAKARTVAAVLPEKIIEGDTRLQYSSDGNRIFSLDQTSKEVLNVKVRDAQGNLLDSHDLRTDQYPDVTLIGPDGKHVLTSRNQHLTVYDLESGKKITFKPEHIAKSGQDAWLIIDSKRAQAVRIFLEEWDRKTGKFNPRFYGYNFSLDNGALTSKFVIKADPVKVTLSPDGSKVLLIEHDKTARQRLAAMYDTANGRLLWKEVIPKDEFDEPVHCAWSSNGTLVSFDTKNTTQLRVAQTGATVDLPKRGNRLINKPLAISEDGKRFLMLEPLSRWVTLYDAASDKNIFRYEYDKDSGNTGYNRAMARIFFNPRIDSGQFLIDERDKATIFQINEDGVQRVVKEGMY